MIPRFGSSTAPELVADALERAGVVVLSPYLEPVVLDRFDAELRPHLSAREATTPATARVSALFARSFTLGDMILDPLLVEVIQRVLGAYCFEYQVSAANLTRVEEGEALQRMHRDGDAYAPYFGHDPKRHPTGVSCTWMLTDASEKTGAPRFVVGSHTWPADRSPTEEEIVCAEVDRGALAIHLGGTLHASGFNEHPRPFASVEVRFTLGWLRQEENQYLSIPADRLERFPERVRALLGWRPQGPALGWVGGHDLPSRRRRSPRAD